MVAKKEQNNSYLSIRPSVNKLSSPPSPNKETHSVNIETGIKQIKLFIFSQGGEIRIPTPFSLKHAQ